MFCQLRKVSSVLLGAVVAIAGVVTAQAGPIRLEIQQGDNPAVFSTTGTNTFVSATSVEVGDYRIDLTGGSANTPGTDFNAILELTTLSVTRFAETSTAPLYIRLLADDFLNPAGNPLYMGSSIGAAFTGLSDGDLVQFISYFNTNNSNAFMAGIASDVASLIYDENLTDASGSRAPTKTVARLNPAFSLSNVTMIDLKTVGSTTVGTSGVTEVRNQPFGPEPANGVVPEPTSLALLACGGLGLIGVRLRNRRRQAC